MKHLSLLLFALVCYTSSLHAQDFWEQLYFPDSTNIFSIAVNNQGNIFIGAGSGIYRSIDNGENWNCMGLIDHTFYSMAINNNGDIYAGSNQDINYPGLFRSIDNGLTWDTINPNIGVYGNILSILAEGDTLFVSVWSGQVLLIRSIDGGQTWESVFTTTHGSEKITDIIKSANGDIYFSLTGYFADTGGIYKSEDGGETWNFIGLFNSMVSSLAMNTSGDLYAGSWDGYAPYYAGVYVLRNGSQDWEVLISGPQISDMVINSDNHIYCTSSWPNGVIRSLDNGENFELINSGLPGGPMGYMTIDNNGYLYITSEFQSNFIAKTIETTVDITESKVKISNSRLLIYPNPVTDIININLYTGFTNTPRLTFCIYDQYGKQCVNRTMNTIDDHIQIDVSNLKTGIYFISILEGNNKLNSKFIKN